MELKWDDAPLSDPVPFSKDVFDKFSLAPTIEELWAVLQSPAVKDVKEESKTRPPGPSSEPTQAKCDNNTADSKETSDDCKTKKKEGFPEPRVPYPCYCSLTHKERMLYLRSLKNSKNRISQCLREKMGREIAEFMKYLQDVSRVCADDYKYMPPGAARYSEEFFKACLEHMKYYPQAYSIHEITSLTGGKLVADITLNFEKQLLGLGSVQMVEKEMMPKNRDLAVDYDTVSAAISPLKKASYFHTPVSSDTNAEKLSARYKPHVCLAKEAFLQLLNNSADYAESWELPVCVRVTSEKDGGQFKTVFIDPPLLKTEMTWRERSHLIHEESIKLVYKKTDISPVCMLTTEGNCSKEDSVLEEKNTREVVTFDDTDMDFDVDLTELEMFGESCQPNKITKSHNETKAQSKSPRQRLSKCKEVLDKPASSDLLVKGASTPKYVPSTPSTLAKKEQLEEQAKTCDEESSHEESAETVPKPASEKNPLKKGAPGAESSATESPPAKRTRLSSVSHSDSEDDRLIIDHPISRPGKTQITLPDKGNIADIASPSDSEQGSDPATPRSPASPASGAKKGSKRPRISKDCDQLGQILRMQNAMLKSSTDKNQEPPKAQSPNYKPAESRTNSHPLTLVKPCVSSYLESREGQDTVVQAAPAVSPCTAQRKRLLKEELVESTEDEQDYEAPSEGSTIYKLYSLLDVLLMVRSSVHIAHSIHDQDATRAVPVHVLPKLEYQLCYGGESLTHTEACQIWAECLLHSSTISFIGRINAHTSTLVQLHELQADWIQNTSCDFKPARCLNTLHHILKRVTDLQEGRYLLAHKPGEAIVTIYKATDEKKSSRSVYDLQAVHGGPPVVSLVTKVPWVPLDPFHLMPFHQKNNKPPCTFPPRPPPKAGEAKGAKQGNTKSAPAQRFTKAPTQQQNQKKRSPKKKKKCKKKSQMKKAQEQLSNKQGEL